VTAIQRVDKCSREQAESKFAMGVPYTEAEMESRAQTL